MYLHEDKDQFKTIIVDVSAITGKTNAIVEKDYYVTLILRKLSEQLENCVFKGGTSLSKGFHVIDRFSEDIDITFDQHIGESRRKKLKNVVLKGISEELHMPILNWEYIQSDRDYNAYHFGYQSVFSLKNDRILDYVKLETALGSYSFPTEIVEISSYIGDYFVQENCADLAKKYLVDSFSMKLQSIERTYIDKVFALCDYYMEGKSERYSRHLYDLYKLTPKIILNTKFIELVQEVREHRSKMKICPSAQPGIDIAQIVNSFCKNNFYKEDYQKITSYFVEDPAPYDETIKNLLYVIETGIFSSQSSEKLKVI